MQLNQILIFWACYREDVGRDSSVGTGWTTRGLNPGGGEIFLTRPARPWGPLSLLCNGYRVFPGGKVAGV
jgi:hypothetical protein